MRIAPGGTPVEKTALREILGHYPTGVAVIATIYDGQPVGMAVGSFTSVSLDPPRIGFLVDKSSTTWPRIHATGSFAVNVLGEHHALLARQFATKHTDRFHKVPWRPGDNGMPLIDGAVVVAESDITNVIEAGDHWFVMGSVLQIAAQRNGGPLLFHRGSFARLGRDQGGGEQPPGP